ncbi:MAG: hypothetical protein OER86_05090 [Phycisphaerae bacterium]|nr:hypothetical protein [Phycisphaerae bacterium]
MHIHSVGHGPLFVDRLDRPGQPAPPTKPAEAEPVSADVVETSPEPQAGGGPLRLLAEGHFKGVADVRLRINFAEQIDARQAALVAETAGEQVGSIASAVDQGVQSLLDGEELADEQRTAIDDAGTGFNDTLSGIGESLGEVGSTATSDLAAPLEAAFDQLVIDLRAALEPVEAEADVSLAATDESEVAEASEETSSPTGESPAVGDAVETGSDLAEVEAADDLLAGLIDVFKTALADLQEAVAATSYLPPISKPSGQGAAYAKFLAIYEAIASGPSDVTESDAGEALPLDVIA